jgi:hypothetical protein
MGIVEHCALLGEGQHPPAILTRLPDIHVHVDDAADIPQDVNRFMRARTIDQDLTRHQVHDPKGAGLEGLRLLGRSRARGLAPHVLRLG